MRKWLTPALLVAAIVGIFLISFVAGSKHGGEEKFVGADSAATSLVEQQRPGYKPWIEPLFEPGSSEVESGLFALQAGLGGIVLGFVGGALWMKRRGERAAVVAPPAPEPASAG